MILISVDTLRWDAVGAYGGEMQTPVLDRLAAEGVRVVTALAPSPETGPSHATLVSGQYVSTHGMRQNGPTPFETLPLASAFGEAGYNTAGIVSSYVLTPHFGWDQGFDDFDAEFTYEESSLSVKTLAKPLQEVFEGLDRPGPATSSVAASWLEGVEEPFFLFLHYFDPHMPYTRHADVAPRMAGIQFDMKGRSGPTRKMRRWTRATLNYLGEVLYLDDSLGMLLEVLEARGLKERTLVVLTGDHGEALGEHDWLGHTVHLYEEQIRVPLILRWPETLAAGHRVETPLGLVDVAPTIAELVGIDLPGPVDGRSIADALRDRVEPEARPVMGLRRQLFQLKVPYMGERHYVRTARWKYIRGTDGPEELYDLDMDPLELTNRATEHPDVVARLSVLLNEQQARSAPPSTPELSAEEVEALRALGYAE